MTAAERTYQLLLRAYPRRFRAEYGREMALAFRAQRRDAQESGVRFWTETIADILRSAPALQIEALRMQQDSSIHTGEGTFMRMTIAILAVMVGALETMNALQEAWGSGVLNHDTRALLAGTVAMVAGGLLISAGAALLRRSPNANALAQGAAITSLLVFAFLGAFVPLLSVFALILGIGFPMALLAFVHWSRRRDRSAPIVA